MKTPKLLLPWVVILWLIAAQTVFSQIPNDDLIKACSTGNLASVKTLVDAGANVNYKNAGGATPIASAYMWPEITEYLLGKGADVVSIMLGPNPGRSETSDPEAKNLGQFYCGTRTFFSSPLIFKESKGIFGQYDGMGNVLAAHAKKMCTYVNGKEKDAE